MQVKTVWTLPEQPYWGRGLWYQITVDAGIQPYRFK